MSDEKYKFTICAAAILSGLLLVAFIVHQDYSTRRAAISAGYSEVGMTQKK